MKVALMILILVLIVVVLLLAIAWFLWATVGIRGSLRKTSEDNTTKKRSVQLDAEVYVETYRQQKQSNHSSSDLMGRGDG